MPTGRLGFVVVVDKFGTESVQESKEVSAMRKLLAVVVVGASLAFASTAAFAEDRGVVEPVSQPSQPATVSGYFESNPGTFAGGPAHDVSVDASRGQEGSSR
jgi:hypothetical protein